MSKQNSDKKVVEISKSLIEDSNDRDNELFNFLRQMHLTGGSSGLTLSPGGEGLSLTSLTSLSSTQTQILASRKRKAWEGLNPGTSKWTGGQRPPALRSADPDDDHLQTPNCSNTGFEDEEDHRPVEDPVDEEQEEAEEAGEGSDLGVTGVTHINVPDVGKHHHHHHHHLLSPGAMLHLNEDIDADNLAADFDGSFTGLGVDINTANYSMSEAMLSINNIAVQQQLVKEEANSGSGGDARLLSLKSEGALMFSNYGALDLSNDDAQHPDSEQSNSPQNKVPPTFSGSVSRENSQDAVRARIEVVPVSGSGQRRASNIVKAGSSAGLTQVTSSDFRVPHQQSVILTYSKQQQNDSDSPGATSVLQGHRVVTTTASAPAMTKSDQSAAGTASGATNQSSETQDLEGESRFQYILAAPTSILTKPGDPSLTYINQGQSYEIKIKKLGDISGHYKKKWLRGTIRICFHERRLQYIEAEQIAEWSRSHPNERILEIDMPLSYGIADVRQDSSNLSTVSFLWDPTRDTGIFIKVHCISTEFTPKKHGGERGVPFRLQIETFSSEAGHCRLHAGACILQVFKLKGADRKHKQDRDKISKRPDSSKDKFSPQCECTVLTDLSVDSIYIPNSSRGVSPIQSDNDLGGLTPPASSAHRPPVSLNTCICGPSVSTNGVARISYSPANGSREESPQKTSQTDSMSNGSLMSTGPLPGDSKTWKIILPHNATSETTSGWLAYNRYGQFVKTFSHYDARDMLRLSKDELVQMIGMVDGVRLYNDLHLKPVSPRLSLFLAPAGDSAFTPVMLQDVTVTELVKNVAEIIDAPSSLFNKVLMEGPNKISIKLTDEFLRHQPPDSAYFIHLIQGGETCDIRLEPVK